MIELVDRRADAVFLVEQFAATQRKACELANIARSSYRYRARTERNHQLKQRLVDLAQEQPRYGYRRLGVLLRRAIATLNLGPVILR